MSSSALAIANRRIAELEAKVAKQQLVINSMWTFVNPEDEHYRVELDALNIFMYENQLTATYLGHSTPDNSPTATYEYWMNKHKEKFNLVVKSINQLNSNNMLGLMFKDPYTCRIVEKFVEKLDSSPYDDADDMPDELKWTKEVDDTYNYLFTELETIQQDKEAQAKIKYARNYVRMENLDFDVDEDYAKTIEMIDATGKFPWYCPYWSSREEQEDYLWRDQFSKEALTNPSN